MTKLSDKQLSELIAYQQGLDDTYKDYSDVVTCLQELQALRAKPIALSVEQWREIREALKEYNGQGEWVSTSAAEEALALMDSIEAGK